MFKYYSTLRPLGPGSIPNRPGNKPIEVVNFDEIKEIESIGKPAYGYAIYAKSLSEQDCYIDDLVLEGAEENE